MKKTFSRSVCAFVLVLVGLLIGNVSQAQETGTISGTVVLEGNGEPVHGTLVLIIELGRSTTTNDGGHFEFRAVPVGEYEILAQREHLTAERQRVSVTAEGTVEVSFTLELSPVHESVTVTASVGETTALEAFNNVTAIDSVDLAKNIAGTVGEILESEPGIAKRSFGPGPSRPIIRGFDGDRVLIMQDGMRTADLSSQSGDHGVTIDPAGLDRIEVVKGPATLLYGSNAIGGVVNAVTPHESFPRTKPEGVQGRVTADGGTANDQGGVNGNVQFGQGNWALWGGGGGVRTGDYQSPEGTVSNSATRLSNGDGGVGYYGDKAYASVGYHIEDSRYGIPFAGDFEAPGEGIDIDISTTRKATRADVGVRNLDNGFAEAFRVAFNYVDYNHQEIEVIGDEEEIGTTFDNNTLSIRAEGEQHRTDRLAGKFGIEALFRDYRTVGAEALAPFTDQNAIAAFVYEELSLTPKARLQFGGRVENNDYQPGERPEPAEDEAGEGGEELEPPEVKDRSFTGFSGSVGIHLDVASNTAFVANLTRSYRSPALEELYNFGPHLGNFAFEIGDPDLEREAAVGVDVSLRNKSRWVDGEISFYYYGIDNFVFPAFTDEIEDGLRVAPYLQGDSRFVGVDGKALFGIRRYLWLDLSAGYVDAQLTADDQPLPRIPPFHGRIGVDFTSRGFSVKPEVILAAKQDEIFVNETPTDGYTLLNVTGSYTLAQGHVAHVFSVQGYNLTNELYRNHTSFIKDLAPEMGRGVKASYSLRFF
jgi:iron complex outermembrane receptor protein